MPSSNPILPMWVVAPIGMLTLLVLAGHVLAIWSAPMDRRRRRIRLTSSGLLMLMVPLFCYGLSGAAPSRSRQFVLIWLLVVVVLLFVILLAMIDMVHSMQIHRAQARNLRKSLTAPVRTVPVQSSKAQDRDHRS